MLTPRCDKQFHAFHGKKFVYQLIRKKKTDGMDEKCIKKKRLQGELKEVRGMLENSSDKNVKIKHNATVKCKINHLNVTHPWFNPSN